ncbi:MAG TPA: ABC transporter permease [Propionibacteriaceae bacterium]|nr:ABC transporter permease [Propionibacteriaceae bacterium]
MNLDWAWINRNLEMIGGLLVEHVILALVPVVLAFVISLPLGYLVFKTGKPANGLLAILGVIYSIPSLALFVLMPLVLGTQILNPANIVAALAVYSIALLVRSVVDGLRSVSPSVKQSASAMGYGSFRRLSRVELPLAMPVIFAGLRVVTVSNIALVSVAVLVGSGALGKLFDLGFGSYFYTPIIVALVLTLALALIADGLILLIQRGSLPWLRRRVTA